MATIATPNSNSSLDFHMKQYELPVIIYKPIERTENKYMAEVPVLPGCRAWGDTPAEAMDILKSVTGEFILSYLEHGEKLPEEVEEAALELAGPKASRDLGLSKEDFDKAR